MGADEIGTLRDLTQRRAILDGLIAAHRGRIANTAGDSVLAEFGSVVDAVRCAVEAQAALAEANAGASPERHMNFRIGVHVGDVMVKGGDLFGDGVNIAARLQTLASAGGVCVSGVAHDQVKKILPFAFTDLGAQHVKNIEEPVRAFNVSATSGSAIGDYATTSIPLTLPDKPSIAVLPFQNMSGDPEQEYFADGIVEDIITALSRFKSLFVIARNSSFTYKGKSVDIKQVGRELGVRYVLEGSVRRSGNRVRITAQLIDAPGGAHVWADRFEGTLDDVFALQDEVTEKVAAAIAPRVERAELSRAMRRSSDNTDAYECYWKGLSCVGYDLNRALDLFTQASNLDPEFASAYGMAMFCLANRTGWGLTRDIAKDRTEVSRLRQIVVRIGSDDGVALAQAGWATAHILRDLPGGKELIERAVELNPNVATAWGCLGWINIWMGHPAVAKEHLLRSQRLDPNPFFNSTSGGLAHACFFLDEYDEALAHVEHVLHRNPDAHPVLRIGAASAAFAGRDEVAQRLGTHLVEVDPAFSVSRLKDYTGPYQRVELLEKYQEGLRRAGVPEISARPYP
jgi:adenylate cyclase